MNKKVIKKSIIILSTFLFIFSANLTKANSVGTGTGILNEIKIEKKEEGNNNIANINNTETGEIVIEEITSTGSIETNTNKTETASTDLLLERINKIKERLGINQTTDLEKEFSNLNKNISEAEIEKKILKEIISKNKEEENKNKDLLNENNESIKLIEEQLKNLTKNKTENLELVNTLKDRLLDYQTKEQELLDRNNLLKENVEIANKKLQELEFQLEQLEVYKEKYNEKIIEEKETIKKEEMQHVYVYLGMFIFFFLILFILKIVKKNVEDKMKEEKLNKINTNDLVYEDNIEYNFKRKDNKNTIYILDVIAWIIFIIIFIIYTISIKPEIGLMFVFLGSTLLLSIKPLLSSFFSSLSVITNYKVGDIVKIGASTGKIIEISPLAVTLKEFDNNQLPTRKEIKLPNSLFVEAEVGLFKQGILKKEINLILKLNENNILNNFLNDLEEIFKNKKENDKDIKYYFNISMKTKDEIDVLIIYYYTKRDMDDLNKIEKEIFELYQNKYLIITTEENNKNKDKKEENTGKNKKPEEPTSSIGL